MKFDLLIMNPPYQPPVKPNSAFMPSCGRTIYPKFVRQALKHTKASGYTALIIPPSWRKPPSSRPTLWNELKDRIHYLSMYDHKAGYQLFNAGTAFDLMVLGQPTTTTTAKVIGTDRLERQLDLLDGWQWLPNCEFDLIKSLLAESEEEACAASPRVAGWSDDVTLRPIKSDEYWYPCVYSTPLNKPIRYFWAREPRHAFPKIIFSDAFHIRNVIVDIEGQYGLSVHAIALHTNDPEEAALMKQALESDKFNYVLKSALRWSQIQINGYMFQYFRKDFWKAFLD